MRMLQTLGQLLVGAALILVAVAGSRPTSAAERGSTWQQPVTIRVGGGQFTDYHKLQATGDAVYYQLTISAPTQLRLQVSTSRAAATKFAPQVVLFQPNDSTVGPILPVQQPPDTLASVYPMTTTREVFDAFTQTTTSVRLDAQPMLAAAGTYTFAVYNAGSVGGQFRFILDRGSSLAQWQDCWRLPIRWWQDQTFAGFSWLTLISPVLLGLLLWILYLRLDHHRLHVHKTYPSAVKKKTS